MHRLGVVVHPTRAIDQAMASIERWTRAQGVELVQVETGTVDRRLAPVGRVEACDLVAAVGGDGTVLAALRAAAPTGTAVLGVACGSLGALSAVSAGELPEALDRYAAGAWTAQLLPGLAVDGPDGPVGWALNDVVVRRRGTTQLVVDVRVGGELYARVAGDGVVVATPMGSSAYSMAAGGPVLATGTDAFVCTPLAMHGGSAPPLVVPAAARVELATQPGFGGFDLEADGHPVENAATEIAMSLQADRGTLVAFGELGNGLASLRRRGLIADSPRVLARDERARRLADEGELGGVGA